MKTPLFCLLKCLVIVLEMSRWLADTPADGIIPFTSPRAICSLNSLKPLQPGFRRPRCINLTALRHLACKSLLLQAGCWAGPTQGLNRAGVIYEGTSDKEKKKKARVLLGHAGRQHGCFPSLVFNTVNNLPCFLVSSEDAMADIHGSRGN